MTKKEMILEMMPEKWKTEEAINNRLKNSKIKIEKVYNFWQMSAKEEKDKVFCTGVLTVF